MSADRSLYLAASDELAFRRLVGTRFEGAMFAPTCAFGRVDADGIADAELAAIARAHADAIVLDHASVTGAFYFGHYRAGELVRELAYADGWRVVRGTPEPWEAELESPPVAGADGDDFHAWSACDLVGTHHRLSGWFESVLPPRAPSARDATMARLVHELLERKAAAGRAATTLPAALEAVGLGVPIAREVFAAHAEMYILVDAAGAPHVHDHTLRVYTSADDLAAYLSSWEAPILQLRGGPRLDGAQVLALAAQVGASHLNINPYGCSIPAMLDATTLSGHT